MILTWFQYDLTCFNMNQRGFNIMYIYVVCNYHTCHYYQRSTYECAEHIRSQRASQELVLLRNMYRNCQLRYRSCHLYVGNTYKCDKYIRSQRAAQEPLLLRNMYRNRQLHYRSCHLYVGDTYKCATFIWKRVLTQRNSFVCVNVTNLHIK
jgi:hypothetical protein